MAQYDNRDDELDHRNAANGEAGADGQVEEELLDEEEEQPKATLGWTGWLISATLHVLMIALMGLLVWAVKAPEVDTPPVRVASIEPPPKKPDPPKETTVTPTTVPLDVESDNPTPNPVTNLDLPVEQSEREADVDNPVPKGREEAVADSEMGGSGAFMAIGAGGGSAGMFGARGGGGKKRAIGKFGGSKGSESAVDAALQWFKKHQSPNGMWDVTKYPNNCTDAGPKCEPGAMRDGNCNVGVTGYAVLCFLGAGYDHMTPNKYKATVKKGIDYLVSVQGKEGMLGDRNYENAIATMALAEAYAMTSDPALKDPAQKGVDASLKNQNKDGKAAAAGGSSTAAYLGWDYKDPTLRNDSSVTGWNIMMMKSALAAQLNISHGMEGAKNWLDKTWKATNKDWAKLDPYKDVSRFPYVYTTDSGAIEINAGVADEKDFSCVGAVCAVFLGHKAGDAMLETLVNYDLKNHLPTKYPCNTYYMYYDTLALFQVGGDKWKKWNDSVRDVLVNGQRKDDGCFKGSWDFADTKFVGSDVGRTLSTAYCCLSLEVYYRYAQVAGH